MTTKTSHSNHDSCLKQRARRALFFCFSFLLATTLHGNTAMSLSKFGKWSLIASIAFGVPAIISKFALGSLRRDGLSDEEEEEDQERKSASCANAETKKVIEQDDEINRRRDGDGRKSGWAARALATVGLHNRTAFDAAATIWMCSYYPFRCTSTALVMELAQEDIGSFRMLQRVTSTHVLGVACALFLTTACIHHVAGLTDHKKRKELATLHSLCLNAVELALVVAGTAAYWRLLH